MGGRKSKMTREQKADLKQQQIQSKKIDEAIQKVCACTSVCSFRRIAYFAPCFHNLPPRAMFQRLRAWFKQHSMQPSCHFLHETRAMVCLGNDCRDGKGDVGCE